MWCPLVRSFRRRCRHAPPCRLPRRPAQAPGTVSRSVPGIGQRRRPGGGRGSRAPCVSSRGYRAQSPRNGGRSRKRAPRRVPDPTDGADGPRQCGPGADRRDAGGSDAVLGRAGRSPEDLRRPGNPGAGRGVTDRSGPGQQILERGGHEVFGGHGRHPTLSPWRRFGSRRWQRGRRFGSSSIFPSPWSVFGLQGVTWRRLPEQCCEPMDIVTSAL